MQVSKVASVVQFAATSHFHVLTEARRDVSGFQTQRSTCMSSGFACEDHEQKSRTGDRGTSLSAYVQSGLVATKP